jgi:hypothetical protein
MNSHVAQKATWLFIRDDIMVQRSERIERLSRYWQLNPGGEWHL